jgi:hypothetical protein
VYDHISISHLHTVGVSPAIRRTPFHNIHIHAQFFESENAGNAKRYVSLTPPMHNKRHLQSQQHCSEELDGLIVGIVLLSSLASFSILNNLILSLHQLLQVGLEDLLHGDEVLTMNIEPAEVLALLLRS